jgi:hypothetical protein
MLLAGNVSSTTSSICILVLRNPAPGDERSLRKEGWRCGDWDGPQPPHSWTAI